MKPADPLRVHFARGKERDERHALCMRETEWPLNGAGSTVEMKIFHGEPAKFRHFNRAASFPRGKTAWKRDACLMEHPALWFAIGPGTGLGAGT